MMIARVTSLLLGALLLGLGACTTLTGAPPATVPLRVIAFNDFHGNLRSPGTFSSGPGTSPVPAGGADALAGWVDHLKAGQRNTIVVAAGDLVGASPLVSGLFHDEGTIEAMNRLGLEISSVGNHEFDGGSAELLRKQNGGCFPEGVNTCQGARVGTPVPFEGARFKYLAANVIVNGTGKPLFPAYAVREFDGVKVAFIGMTLAGTPSIVTPTGVAGLEFKDEADTVNALVPELHAQGAQAIVVLIHQGGFQAASPAGDINACSGLLSNDATSPIRAIVRRLDDGVDVVISGHTHSAYNCLLPNSKGRAIPVTQASSYGRAITAVDLGLDRATGRVIRARAMNYVVDRGNQDAPPKASIAQLVAGYNALVATRENQVVGTIASAVVNSPSPAGELAAGDLIADAQLQATAPAALGGSVMAFMNPGGVRGAGFTTGPFPHAVSYGEAFTLQPFGNSLVVLDLTAKQIKDTLEQQFPGCQGQTVMKILQLSQGLTERINRAAAPCEHISGLALHTPAGTDTLVAGGVVLDPAKTYRVTVNNFLSTGGDGFTALQGGRNPLGGAQDIDALVAYLGNSSSPGAPYDPASPVHQVPRILTTSP